MATCVDRYYTPAEQAEWRDRMATAPEFAQAHYLDRWRALSARIESALPLDPASDQALTFVREWFALLEPFTRNATRAMWEGSMRMYEEMDQWDSTVDAGFSKPVWAFIVEATAVARAAGHDVGLLPAFMATS